ncbi:hypothetical protein [Pseudactinotalea sp.]|uniref:hypothetical protein n=1 Tax=Pseudactinotalea sp. TaxID=1926260 RepID=UPI003B3B6B8A
MSAGGVLFLIIGLLTVLAGLLSRRIWRVAAAPMYRNPDAVEPSDLRFQIGQVVGVVIGVGFTIAGIWLLAGSADTADPEAETSSAEVVTCEQLLAQVSSGDTSSLDATRSTLEELADRHGLSLEENETTDEVDHPGSDDSTTIVTTSLVLRGDGTEGLGVVWVDTDGRGELVTDRACTG